MFTRFSLTLIVNHACNLRCAYCYTGEKFARPMSLGIGKKAIDRAIASLDQGGALDLAFFGGEPLIEPRLILDLVDYARRRAADRQIALSLYMTTNGTLDSGDAWTVMSLPEMQLAISHDGLPGVHDRYRVAMDGQPSSLRVLETLERLQDAGANISVVMVVQPGTVDELCEGFEFLYARGVRRFQPSLNLWTVWRQSDGQRLKVAIADAADFWVARLPNIAVSWFDERAAKLSGVRLTETARCGFGNGEIAVAPSGHLYPCERLVGADEQTNPMRLPGGIMEGNDFLRVCWHDAYSPLVCAPCMLKASCSTSTCHCSNYVRTGDVNRPDGLLCLLDQTCYQETLRVLKSQMVMP